MCNDLGFTIYEVRCCDGQRLSQILRVSCVSSHALSSLLKREKLTPTELSQSLRGCAPESMDGGGGNFDAYLEDDQHVLCVVSRT